MSRTLVAVNKAPKGLKKGVYVGNRQYVESDVVLIVTTVDERSMEREARHELVTRRDLHTGKHEIVFYAGERIGLDSTGRRVERKQWMSEQITAEEKAGRAEREKQAGVKPEGASDDE